MTLPANVTSSNAISNRTEVYAAKKMLKHAAPIVILDKFGEMIMMPENKTRSIKFRRPKPFEAQTTPLAEGVTPKPNGLRYDDVPTMLRQYGQVEVITDVIEDTNEDPVLNNMTVQLGENIGRTMEALDWAVLRSGTNVFYANGASRAEVNSKITLAKQRAIIRGLKAQKAMHITQVMDSSPDYNTFSVERSFIGICHTDVENDIRDLPGFVHVSDYGSRKLVSNYEIGSVEEVRYVCSSDLNPYLDAGGAPGSTVVSTSGSAADVYPVLYLGRSAYARVALRGKNAVSPAIIPVGEKTKDDPLGQRGYVGWKAWHACVILNDLWMARLEVSVSAL